jgi:signal transduction histidine kinase
LLRRVIGNLIGNAIKFTAADGEIRVSAARQGEMIRVEVADDGFGIAPEHHARIFTKFGQVGGPRGRGGTGLGLTFARMAVEAHGGRIGVVSAPGKGSTFWLTLPAAQEAPR